MDSIEKLKKQIEKFAAAVNKKVDANVPEDREFFIFSDAIRKFSEAFDIVVSKKFGEHIKDIYEIKDCRKNTIVLAWMEEGNKIIYLENKNTQRMN